MICYVTGDLFSSPAKVLVNTVNTVGVMGKGIALRFKQVYPEMFRQYQTLCEGGQLKIGNLWLYKTPHKWVLNFPTKENWRKPSKPEYIEAGLRKFVASYTAQGITSIAFPRLGCGNGELDWERTVQPLMEAYLDKLPVDIFVYAADQTVAAPEHKQIEQVSEWLRSEPRALAFGEAWNDLTAAIGDGRSLAVWEGVDHFRVTTANPPSPGLRIQLGNGKGWLAGIFERLATKVSPKSWLVKRLAPDLMFIPQEALLALWQSIRTYGFCVPHTMPEHLDLVAQHIMPIMALLPYLRPVKIAQPTAKNLPKEQLALQLFGASASASVEAPERPLARSA